eukprot:8043059-Heterocapsa_arctica.AAC.1
MCAIKTHWRKCQGRLPPKCTPEQRSERSRLVALGAAGRRRQRAIDDYKQKLHALQTKHPSLAGAWCDLQFHAPYDSGAKHRITTYRCSRCGNTPGTAYAIRWPCGKRPASITRENFLLQTRGAKWLKSYRKSYCTRQNAKRAGKKRAGKDS